MKRWLAVLSTLVAVFAAAPAWAQEDADVDSSAVMLVARPVLGADPIYSSSILIARPLPNGGHVGFILNKPTTAKLGDVFPEHGPSQKVVDPVFLGGPNDINVVFALVERRDPANERELQIAPDLFLAVEARDVDHVIESESDHARFYVGMVVWKPGELDTEMERGLWYTLQPDAKIVLDKHPDKLWEQLVRKGKDREHMI